MTSTYTLYPTPHEVMYHGKTLPLTSKVTIITTVNLKPATCHFLEKSLLAIGCSCTFASHPIEGYSSIHFKQAPSVSFNEPEGYTLKLLGTSHCDIVIEGCDLDGFHYGVVTLHHLLAQSQDRMLHCLTLKDYPNILYRGYIEGFYGFPWTHEDRKDLMAFSSLYKLNTYIYAPKDDPYHRSHWRTLYPTEKAQEIAELAQTGHQHNINFVWTIHPGDTINLDSDLDFQATLLKFEQLYDLGVRQFGILFDDIGGYPDGEQQARYINRVDTEFVKAKGDVRPLLTVGTRYCEAWGPSMTTYFKPFVDLLHDDVEIMWTGSATMSNISREQLDAPMRMIDSKKHLSVWWNYPVNDYCDAKLLMGKIENLGTDIDNVKGFFSNPMNQAQASKQALFCVADHNWNTSAFDKDESFVQSFKALAPEVSDALQLFASNCSYVREDGGVSGTFLFDESWYLKDAMHTVITHLEEGKICTDAVTFLHGAFIELKEAVECIFNQCKNKKLVDELRPFLDATYLMGEAGAYTMSNLLDLDQMAIEALEANNHTATLKLQKMDDCKVLRLKDGAERYFTVDVGTYRIKPFLTKVLSSSAILAGIESKPLSLNYTRKNIALSSLGVTATALGEEKYDQEVANAIEGTIKSGKWCSREYRPYLIVDLKEVKNIKQYRVINCGHPEAGETRIWNTKALQILTSIDGENFTLVDEVKDNKEDLIDRLLFTPVDARFVKLQIIEPAQISINGGGHTRIYGFELFDEAYPYQSDKVQPTDLVLASDNLLTIHNVNYGDTLHLYASLDAHTPLVTLEAPCNATSVSHKLPKELLGKRLFFERIAKNYLPSIRTSKHL